MKRPQLFVVFLLLVSWSDASTISEELAKLGFPDHYNGYMKATARDCSAGSDRPVGFCSDCFTQSICSTDDTITIPTDTACATGYVCFENDQFSACVLESEVPDCQCPDETFVTIADPYDTEKFIVCVNGVGTPEKCQEDQVYDPSVSDCEDSNSEPTLEPPVDADTACDGSDEFQEIGVSCTEFVLCGSDGEQIGGGVISCEPGEIFNNITKECEDYPSPFTCSVHEADGYYADTTNCSVYHLCIGGQQFGADNICGEGRFFDQESQNCHASGPESGVTCNIEVTCVLSGSTSGVVCAVDTTDSEKCLEPTLSTDAACTVDTNGDCVPTVDSMSILVCTVDPDNPSNCLGPTLPDGVTCEMVNTECVPSDLTVCFVDPNNLEGCSTSTLSTDVECEPKEECVASDPTAGVTCLDITRDGECEAEYPECSLASLSDCEICPDEITRFGIDCESYYQCTKNEDGDLVPVVRTCPEGFSYDDEGNYCDLDANVEGCPA